MYVCMRVCVYTCMRVCVYVCPKGACLVVISLVECHVLALHSFLPSWLVA